MDRKEPVKSDKQEKLQLIMEKLGDIARKCHLEGDYDPSNDLIRDPFCREIHNLACIIIDELDSETVDDAEKNTLTFSKLRETSSSRAAVWNKGKPGPLSFAMMELAGETGEACNAAKKLAREEMGWVGGSTDVEALSEELADVVICADLAAMQIGVDLGEAVANKFNKTSVKHGFPHRL